MIFDKEASNVVTRIHMKILFDHQSFLERNYGGILRYFLFLYDKLPMSTEIETKISVIVSDNPYLKERKIGFNINESFNFPKKTGMIGLANEYYTRRMINSRNFDILHLTQYNTYFKNARVPKVLTVYDMIHEKLNHVYSGLKDETFIRNKKNALLNADLIISISESTKRDVLEIYPQIGSEKIKVIPLCLMLDEQNSELSEESEELKLQPYFLFVGARVLYKNFELLVNAYSKLPKPPFNLVCAGGGGFTAAEKDLFKKKGIENRIYHRPISNDVALSQLYKNALAFIFPSAYEGFGLPTLEAFSNHCPVILTDNEIFREVAGEAGYFFESNNITSLQSAMMALYNNNSGLRNTLIKNGSERLNFFTPERVIDKTIECYKMVI